MKRKRLLSFSLFILMVFSSVVPGLPVTSAASPIGTNLSRLPGCVYNAGYSESGRGPALAFDGDRTGGNSRWAGGGQNSNWLSVELPDIEPVNYVTIYFETLRKNSGSNNELTGAVVVQFSSDGVDWSQELTRQNYNAYTPKTVTLSFPTVYLKYIRLYFPESQFYLSIYEFEVYYDPSLTSASSNLALLPGCDYTAYYSETNRGPALAFTGVTNNGNSRWAGGGMDFNWLCVRLPESMAVSFVKVYFEALTRSGGGTPLNGTVIVECSSDGLAWEELTRQVYNNYSPRDVTLAFETQYTQYLRLYFPERQYYCSVYEFEVYHDGTDPGGDPTALRRYVTTCEATYTDTYLSQFRMSFRDRYKTALSEAKRVLSLARPTQEDINAALAALQSAVAIFSNSSNRVIFPSALKATPADDWNELLNNLENPDEDDWRAGDGLRSIPLDGVNYIGCGNENTHTAFLFSDSYVTSFKDLSQSLKLNWLQMPNHVFAEFQGIEPDKSKMNYIFGKGGDKSLVRQALTDEGGISNVIPEAFWVQDGIVIDNYLYILFDHENPDLVTINTSMAKIPILPGYKVDWANAQWLGYTGVWTPNRTCMGVSIFDNSTLSGVPAGRADDYLYIYGNSQISGGRRVVCARVKKTTADFEDPEKWEFYTSSGWRAGRSQLNNVIALTNPANYSISSQHCVTYINSGIYEGKYMMTCTNGGISAYVSYMLADNPWGPFTNATTCYYVPEVEQYQNELYQTDNPRAWYVTYNVITHPQLSKPGELLISYDCYVWDSTKWSSNAQYFDPNWHGTETNEYYRERFFRLDLTRLASPERQDSYTLVSQGKTVTASVGSNASNATDANDSTKWEASGAGAAGYDLTVDLGKPMEIGRYILKHAGVAIVNNSDLNARNYNNARKFQVQYQDTGGVWRTVVDKQYNASWQNDENFTPAIARYWRLHIEQPTQGTMDKATVHEFQLFATSHAVVAEAPGGVTVSLSKTIALYGDTVTFTIDKGNTSYLFNDGVTLRLAGGQLLQTLTPNYSGVYSFTMPAGDVIVRLTQAESGIIDGKVEDEPDGVIDFVFTVEKDLIHVSVRTLPNVRKLALYTNGKKIPVLQQVISSQDGFLRWDLWFRMYQPGDYIIGVRGGINDFYESDLKFKASIVSNGLALVPYLSAIVE